MGATRVSWNFGTWLQGQREEIIIFTKSLQLNQDSNLPRGFNLSLRSRPAILSNRTGNGWFEPSLSRPSMQSLTPLENLLFVFYAYCNPSCPIIASFLWTKFIYSVFSFSFFIVIIVLQMYFK